MGTWNFRDGYRDERKNDSAGTCTQNTQNGVSPSGAWPARSHDSTYRRGREDRLGRNGSSEVGLNWGEVSCAGSGLRARARHGVGSAVLIFPVIWSVCLAVKPVGEPDAGNPHIRFDERG